MHHIPDPNRPSLRTGDNHHGAIAVAVFAVVVAIAGSIPALRGAHVQAGDVLFVTGFSHGSLKFKEKNHHKNDKETKKNKR